MPECFLNDLVVSKKHLKGKASNQNKLKTMKSTVKNSKNYFEEFPKILKAKTYAQSVHSLEDRVAPSYAAKVGAALPLESIVTVQSIKQPLSDISIKVKHLMRDYPNGLQLEKFLTAFANKYEFYLTVTDYNCSSLPELLSNLNDIIEIKLEGENAILYPVGGESPSLWMEQPIDHEIVDRINVILEAFNGAIPMDHLPNEYKYRYGKDLQYDKLGFSALPEFLSSLGSKFGLAEINEGQIYLYICSLFPNGLATNFDTVADDSKKQDDKSCIAADVHRKVMKLLTDYFPKGIPINNFTGLYTAFYGTDAEDDIDPEKYGFKALKEMIPSKIKSITIVSDRSEVKFSVKSAFNLESPNAKDKPLFENTIKKAFKLLDQHASFPVNNWKEVVLGEIYSPSTFWLMLRSPKHSGELYELMDRMYAFYMNINLNEITVPSECITVGINVAIKFTDNDFYRGQVTNLPDVMTVRLFLIDYGTYYKCLKSDLRYLHPMFFDLPVQGFHASLYGVADANDRWSKDTKTYFFSLVREKQLYAYVHENSGHQLEISLLDTTIDPATSKNPDVLISKKLIDEGFAIKDPNKDFEAALKLLPPSDRTKESDLEMSLTNYPASPRKNKKKSRKRAKNMQEVSANIEVKGSDSILDSTKEGEINPLPQMAQGNSDSLPQLPSPKVRSPGPESFCIELDKNDPFIVKDIFSNQIEAFQPLTLPDPIVPTTISYPCLEITDSSTEPVTSELTLYKDTALKKPISRRSVSSSVTTKRLRRPHAIKPEEAKLHTFSPESLNLVKSSNVHNAYDAKVCSLNPEIPEFISLRSSGSTVYQTAPSATSSSSIPYQESHSSNNNQSYAEPICKPTKKEEKYFYSDDESSSTTCKELYTVRNKVALVEILEDYYIPVITMGSRSYLPWPELDSLIQGENPTEKVVGLLSKKDLNIDIVYINHKIHFDIFMLLARERIAYLFPSEQQIRTTLELFSISSALKLVKRVDPCNRTLIMGIKELAAQYCDSDYEDEISKTAKEIKAASALPNKLKPPLSNSHDLCEKITSNEHYTKDRSRLDELVDGTPSPQPDNSLQESFVSSISLAPSGTIKDDSESRSSSAVFRKSVSPEMEDFKKKVGYLSKILESANQDADGSDKKDNPSPPHSVPAPNAGVSSRGAVRSPSTYSTCSSRPLSAIPNIVEKEFIPNSLGPIKQPEPVKQKIASEHSQISPYNAQLPPSSQISPMNAHFSQTKTTVDHANALNASQYSNRQNVPPTPIQLLQQNLQYATGEPYVSHPLHNHHPYIPTSLQGNRIIPPLGSYNVPQPHFSNFPMAHSAPMSPQAASPMIPPHLLPTNSSLNPGFSPLMYSGLPCSNMHAYPQWSTNVSSPGYPMVAPRPPPPPGFGSKI